MPLYKYFIGQLVFFGFCYATTFVSKFVFPGGMAANGEFPEMGYLPFGDQYLERGGDPHNIPAHVYDHVKDQLPEGHEVNVLTDAPKMNDLTFASYNKTELPAGYQKQHMTLMAPFSWIHGIMGTNREPSMRPNEHWYSHPEYRGVKIVGGLPMPSSEATPETA